MYNLSFEIPRAPLAGLLVAVAVAISKTSKLVEPVTSRIVILPVPAAIFSLKSSTRLSAAPTSVAPSAGVEFTPSKIGAVVSKVTLLTFTVVAEFPAASCPLKLIV